MKTTPGLVDAEEMAKAHPRQFEIAPLAERADLGVGDVVKVCKDNRVRFFVYIYQIDESVKNRRFYIGRATRAAEEADVEAGARIVFEARHIYQIADESDFLLFQISADPSVMPEFRPAFRWTELASQLGGGERANVLASLAAAMIYQHPDPCVGKAQWLRSVDVWILGPAMMAAAVGWRWPSWAAPVLFFGGLFTIIWNAENYQRQERAESGGLCCTT